MKNNVLLIIVPCYNEEEVLPESSLRLLSICKELETQKELKGKILFVDDGSKDHTWEIVESLSKQHPESISGLKLAHNVGHQNALWAGMEEAAGKCSAIVSIDADLQDNEKMIIDMAEQFLEGKDVIYGVRKEREKDTFFKRQSAQSYYKIMKLAGSDLVYNHADFRLLSERALIALLSFPERNLFIRGLVRQLGFKEGYVYYDRQARQAGQSKYPFSKMLHFAVEGITSFSIKPLRIILYSGIFSQIVSILIIIYALYEHYVSNTVPGWTSILVSIWFIGGTILVAMGIIGSYIGKIYYEVKRRPRYFIEERLNL
ncbi:MAG: glycosyltransferase family 2 protein [Bacteroidales bacterium]|nr:glycosyltransferase family 2 protein [Bacteroidales bacterium]